MKPPDKLCEREERTYGHPVVDPYDLDPANPRSDRVVSTINRSPSNPPCLQLIPGLVRITPIT